MIKQFLLLGFFIFTALGSCYAKADAIMGVWLTQMQDANIEIYKKSDKYYGRVVWLKEPNDDDGNPVVDENNPNPKLRKTPILHMDTLFGLVYNSDGEWNGKLYDPKVGKTYRCKLWIEHSKLKVRGYEGWFHSTRTWTKA